MTVLLLFLAISARGENVETAYLNKLRQAKKSQEILQIRNEFHDLLLSERICRSQLEQQIVPASCYRYLEKLRRWKLLLAAESAERLRELDAACKRSAKSTFGGDGDVFDGSTDDLSGECRRWIERARAVHVYRQQTPIGPNLEMLDNR